MLSNHAQVLYAGIAHLLKTHAESEWSSNDIDDLQDHASAFVMLFDDLDVTCACDQLL